MVNEAESTPGYNLQICSGPLPLLPQGHNYRGPELAIKDCTYENGSIALDRYDDMFFVPVIDYYHDGRLPPTKGRSGLLLQREDVSGERIDVLEATTTFLRMCLYLKKVSTTLIPLPLVLALSITKMKPLTEKCTLSRSFNYTLLHLAPELSLVSYSLQILSPSKEVEVSSRDHPYITS